MKTSLLALLLLLSACSASRVDSVAVPVVALCGTESFPCDTNGRIQGDGEAALAEVEQRFSDRSGAFYCGFQEQQKVTALLVVSTEGAVADVGFVESVETSCADAVRHAVKYLAFEPALVGDVPHPSVWMLPFGERVTVTATHLPALGKRW